MCTQESFKLSEDPVARDIGDDTQEIFLQKQFGFSVSSLHEERYGTQYPLTYKFSFPDEVTTVYVRKWDETMRDWIDIAPRETGEIYNGEEGFRYDSSSGSLHVSAAFPYGNRHILLSIQYRSTDANNLPLFVEITEYYDERIMVVTATMDDYSPGSSILEPLAFRAALEFQRRNIWITIGIVTRHSDDIDFSDVNIWSKLQYLVDGGFVEPASHSRTHPHLSIDGMDYHSEINGSKEDIVNNIILPELFSNGPNRHIYTWISPFGKWDDSVEDYLYDSDYIINRCYQCFSSALSNIDQRSKIYSPVMYSVEMGDTSWDSDASNKVIELNNIFDHAYENGLVYHLVLHPQSVDWSRPYPSSHLDHISNRPDVWYVSLGHLYLYQLTRKAVERVN